MAEQDVPPKIAPDRVARVVNSYLRHHKVGADQLAGLIAEVHRGFAALGRSTPPAQEPPKPAVPIRRSVEQDYIVCLECGFRARTLRRHLRTAHGLEPAAYRARWKLSADHPLTAPGYSARRSEMAREIGLGRRAAAAANPPAIEPMPAAEQQGSAVAASRPEPRRGGRRLRRTPAP
ncbi:MAG TPA: MucR family transcriptional regulator [Stellaceae bacterium]|nr:MucR family transcriptional regulator [Stellaceae bacterium]